MQKIGLHVAFLSLVCLVTSAFSQEAGSLSRTYVLTPKRGEVKQFEEALKNHIEWAKQNGETWNWSTYQIALGERLGSYVCASHGHTLEDFDNAAEFRQKAAARWSQNVAQYLESAQGSNYWLHEGLSQLPSSQQPMPLLAVSIYDIKPFATRDFLMHLRKRHDALKEHESSQTFLTFTLVHGGDDRVTVVRPLASWSEAGENYAKRRAAMSNLEEEERATIRQGLRDATKRRVREIFVLRPDLSHPATAPVENVSSN